MSNLYIKTTQLPATARSLEFQSSLNNSTSSSSSGGVSNFHQLSDVTLSTPLAGQIISYDAVAGKWINNQIISTDTDKLLLINTTNSAGLYITNSAGTTLSSINYNATNNKWYVGNEQIMTGGDVLGALLTGYAVGTDTAISASNNVLTAFQNIQGQINNRTRYNANESITGSWYFNSLTTVNNTLNVHRLGISKVNPDNASGISLWNNYQSGLGNDIPDYGLFMGSCSTFGGHGSVGTFATYFTMNTTGSEWGWIFKNIQTNTNVASISTSGNFGCAGNVNVGVGLSTGTVIGNDGSIELYGLKPKIDFHFENNGSDYTSRIIENAQGILDFNANTRFTGFLSSITYVSGFAGSGWALINNSGSYDLTVDNLNVRKSMSVYELVVNQIRATNGSLWVSDSCTLSDVTLMSTNAYYISIDTANNTVVFPFQNGDVVRCQKYNGRNVKYYTGFINYGGAGGAWLYIRDGAGIPEIGDDLVRIGSTTDTNRQGSLYLTSSDSGAPYLDVLDGVNTETGSFDGKTKVRLGRLDGIIDATYGQLSGYGLYSDNVYLKGTITANAGKISSFTINSNWIRQGNAAYMAENWAGGAIGVGIGKDAGNDYSGVYIQYNNNAGIYGNLSFGKILKHGTVWENKVGLNFYHHQQTLFEISREITTGEVTAKISGFNFTANELYGGSKWGAGAGVGLYKSGAYNMLHAYQDTTNYVRVGYGIDGGTKWGVEGVVNSQSIFSLGTTNKIAGFTFDSQSIQSEGIQLYSSPSSPYINFKQTTDGSWTQSGLFFSTQVYTNVASLGINVLANNTSPYVRWRNDGNYIEIRHTTDTRDENTRIYMQGKVKMFNQLQLVDNLILSFQSLSTSTSTYTMASNIQWNVINFRSYFNGTAVVTLPSTHSYGFRLTIVIDKANAYGITMGNFYNNNGDATTMAMAKGDIIELMWVGYWQLINARV